MDFPAGPDHNNAERLEKALCGHCKATLDGWRQEIGEISVEKIKWLVQGTLTKQSGLTVKPEITL